MLLDRDSLPRGPALQYEVQYLPTYLSTYPLVSYDEGPGRLRQLSGRHATVPS